MSKKSLIKIAGAIACAVVVSAGQLSAQYGSPSAPQTPPASGRSTPTQTPSSGAPTQMTPPHDMSAMGDAEFVAKVAKAGTQEVEAGKLAAKQASNATVKAFANRMVTDHQKAGDELMAIAKKHNMSWPTMAATEADKKAAIEKLMALQGSAFDTAYIDSQVTAHKDAVALFEAESKDGKNTDLKAFAAKTLPTLRDHLKEAEAAKAAIK
jgi:putative membrane protein